MKRGSGVSYIDERGSLGSELRDLKSGIALSIFCCVTPERGRYGYGLKGHAFLESLNPRNLK